MKDIQKEIIAYPLRRLQIASEKPERLRMFMRSTEDTSV